MAIELEINYEQLMININDILPQIKSSADDIEQERRLPLSLVETLRETGVFRMAMPKSMGGLELDPVKQIEIIETLSRANASVGWCVMIGCDSGYFASFLKPKIAQDMYPNPDMITAAAVSTTGDAKKVDGGYLVSGRWPFASGCQHSAWLVAGCKVYENDQLSLTEAGVPKTVQCFFHANQVEIVDCWNSLGLRGSGSHDFTAKEVFIPEEKTFSFQNPVSYLENALYQFPLAFMFNFSAVPLGIAQHAIDSLIAAADKPVRPMTRGGEMVKNRTLKHETFVQEALGHAVAKLAAARAYLYSDIDRIWKTLSNKQPLTSLQMSSFLTMITEVFSLCQQVVELTVKSRGGSTVYSGNELERALRDIITINQHAMTSLRNYSQTGKVLMGLAPDEVLL